MYVTENHSNFDMEPFDFMVISHNLNNSAIKVIYPMWKHVRYVSFYLNNAKQKKKLQFTFITDSLDLKIFDVENFSVCFYTLLI